MVTYRFAIKTSLSISLLTQPMPKFTFFFLLLLTACNTERVKHPNVVIMFVDDMGYGDIHHFDTPNLDQMIEDGVHFTDFYVSQAVCSASRASLLTGNYANRIGIHGALGPSNTHGLHQNEITLGELFQSQGYATAAYGKWHLGHHPEFLPLEHGFDDYYGIPYSNDMWPFHPENPDAWGNLPTIERDSIIGYNTDQSLFTTEFTDRGVAFIQSHASAEIPFFLYIAHPMPHVPLFVSKRRQGITGAGLYSDVIHEIDWSIGEILNALQGTGIDDQTLVIFASDNGPWLSYGTHAGSSGPLREGKGTAWEGGVRVPFIAQWSGTIPQGLTIPTPAMTIDLFPTLAYLIDAPLPNHPIDGKNIWPLMSGQSEHSPQKAYFFYYRQNELHALRSRQWKLYFPHQYRTMDGQKAGADGIPGKYTHRQTGLELYDLTADIGETLDVSQSHPEVVEQLTLLADSMRLVLGDQLQGVAGSQIRAPGQIQSTSPDDP